MIIASYESVTKNLKFLSRIKFSYFVLDEAHKIKNDEAVFSEVVRQIRTSHKLLLTGTPLSNHLTEVWSLLNFTMPTIFSSKETFEQFFGSEDREEDPEQYSEVINKLHSILAPFMLRRLKQDTNLNLPPKKEVYVFCPLSLMQKNLYKSLVASKLNIREIRSGSLIMDLRKTAIHPYLFPDMDTEESDYGEHLITNSGKFLILDKMLDKFVTKGDSKVLVFSQFTSVLNIVEDYLNWRQFEFLRIDGGTSLEDRIGFMEEFQQPDTKKKIFLLSTRAGGLGINLIASNIVIFLDSDWNPQMDLQAMDRAHRIGQKKPVFVYRLISKNTVDELIIEKQTIKIKLDYLIIERGRKLNRDLNLGFDIKTLNEQEIRDIAYFGANNILNLKDGTLRSPR